VPTPAQDAAVRLKGRVLRVSTCAQRG
jgi:hypothetical protein